MQILLLIILHRQLSETTTTTAASGFCVTGLFLGLRCSLLRDLSKEKSYRDDMFSSQMASAPKGCLTTIN